MSETTILVIDDSATIRKMVDTHLSREGYRVVLAPTAEEGIEFAQSVSPDLILLDHQLPGTLGIEVARQLSEMPAVASIPVVVSSTLRKQAYMEYTEQSNVVDSLPKPYTPELLKTTVANAVENGAMIVASQSGGTAVPEVHDANSTASLSGSLAHFSLREILDFLNNSQHTGMLEVETAMDRVYFYIKGGRIQAVVSPSVGIEQIEATLPAKMKDLGPLLKFTAGTGFSSQVDGLVELLDRKVLDPRMLKALLRHQAAVLTRLCFEAEEVRSFSFESDREVPSLFTRSKLESSLASLLVDASLTAADTPECNETIAWVRKAIRGQNLDRGGLDAKHMKLLSHLEDPITAQQLADKTGVQRDEIVRVLCGLEAVDWIERREHKQTRQVIAMESDRDAANMLRDLLGGDHDLSGRVVRDRLGLQLLLKRNTPDCVILPTDVPESAELIRQLRESADHQDVRLIAVTSGEDQATEVSPDAVLSRPYTLNDVLEAVNATLESAPVTASV
ncbi:MAG: response regulator [Planctomycetaceae bacterium]